LTVREHPVADHTSLIDADTQLIDVREPGEVAGGSLPGFVNIPLGQLPSRVGELDPRRRVLLLCRSGNRSGQAAYWLAAQGFDDVVNLEGGMLAAGRVPAR
jgi:rhodanese-related sulfurtransferase